MQAIVVLVLGGLAIYLYYLLMQWMVVAVVPECLIVASVLAASIIPIIYGHAIWKVFEHHGWKRILRGRARRLLWGPVALLLALVSADVAFGMLWTLSQVVQAGATPILDALLRPLVSPSSWLVAELRAGLGVSLGTLSGVLAGAAAKGVLIVPLLLAIRGLDSNVRDENEPAYRQYFFGQAYEDVKKVFSEAVEMSANWCKTAGVSIYIASKGIWSIFTWPLSLTAALTLVVVATAATLMLGIVLAVHLLGVLLVWMISAYVAVGLSSIERGIVLARRGHAKCPHAGCHEAVPLPVFHCPRCRTAHNALLPGRCGTFRRKCQCGEGLPTLFMLGKGRLPSACRACDGALSERLFADSIHVPIYGGPSSGKTMFMMAATWCLAEGKLPNVQAEFVNESDDQIYDTQWKPSFAAGRLSDKTHELLPRAFLLSVRRKAGLPLSLYMYDPAGEALQNEAELEGHRFLEYFDGLALLIDPLALPSLARSYNERTGEAPPSSTSSADPLEIVNHVVNALESQARLSRRRKFPRRIAVVFTKQDMPVVAEAFGLPVDGEMPGPDWKSLGVTRSDRIRDWLAMHEPALFQVLEARFSDLRFFAVSATGVRTSGQPGFSPAHIMDPLCWLLSRRAAMAHPRAARWSGRGAEVLAAAVVLGCFALAPYAASRGLSSVASALPGERAALAATIPSSGASSTVLVATAPSRASEPPPGMVLVPAGQFTMGDTRTKGKRSVLINMPSAFYIDRTEVTAGAYQECVDVQACKPAGESGTQRKAKANTNPLCTGGDPTRSDRPINCVDRSQAAAYCGFVDKRLPTEAEWEYAARGPDRRIYPWGDEAKVDCSRAVTTACGRRLADVGARAMGASPFGALDMVGNVAEWVADGWSEAPLRNGASDPMVSPRGVAGILRGGAWDLAPARVWTRSKSNAASAGTNTGFRCAKTRF
jgi:formylglycine-generating enzyme required for sulfatase activity